MLLITILCLFTITQVVIDDHRQEPNLFHRHFATLFVSVVIIYDISRKLQLGIEKFVMQTLIFCTNHRMLLSNAEPLNIADLKLWNVLFYSEENLIASYPDIGIVSVSICSHCML